MMESRRSNRITNINFVCTILIVILHCRISVENIDTSRYAYYPYLYKWTSVLTDVAVPTFFAMSAFLLFRNYTINKYWSKLKNRVRSLMIPYFIFSALFLIIACSVSYLLKGEIHLTFRQGAEEFLLARNNPPTWYLRTLFLFVVISPIFFYFAKLLNLWAISLVSIFLMAFLSIHIQPYSSLQFWAPILIFFAGVAIKNEKIKQMLIGGDRIAPRYFSYLAICVLLISITITTECTEKSTGYYLFRMFSPVLVFIISDLFTWKPLKIQKYSFFIFLTHWLPMYATKSISGHPLLNIPRIIFVLFFCIVIANVIEQFFPKLYKILAGGR